MLALSFALVLAYSIANAFGAWSVVRRKPRLAALFMLAASVLMVAALALVTALPFARGLLATGLVLASLASLGYSYLVLGRVHWWQHLLRALLALGIYLLADAGLA